MRKPLLALGMLCLLPWPALAFMSIESDSIDTPEAGGSGLVSGALDGHSGNTDFQDYSLGGRAHYQAGVTGMYLLGEYDNARVDNSRIAESSWVHGGYQDEFQHGLAAEAFFDYQKNDFRMLANRTQFGIGPRFTLDLTPDQRAVYAGVGLLHEWKDEAGSSSDYWRLNSYAAYKRQLTPETRVLFDFAYQPRLGNGTDFLANTELSLLVKMGTNADLKVGVKYAYDNKSPVTVKPNDTIYGTSFEYRFE